MLWSILIPTVPDRADLLRELVTELDYQIGNKPVEILTLLDNRKRSIGAKRNALIKAAKGDYISFVDDDDVVEDKYVSSIVDAIQENPVDVITFTEVRQNRRGRDLVTVHSLDAGEGSMREAPAFSYELNTWTGLPSHLCVWRRDLAKGVKFEDTSWQEDFKWMQDMSKIAHTHHKIEDHLYTYRMGHRV